MKGSEGRVICGSLLSVFVFIFVVVLLPLSLWSAVFCFFHHSVFFLHSRFSAFFFGFWNRPVVLCFLSFSGFRQGRVTHMSRLVL